MLADIIVLSVVVISVAVGYKRGLLKSLFSVISYVASIVLSFLFYPVLSELLMKTPLYTFLVEKIGENYLGGTAGSTAVSGENFFAQYLSSGIESATNGIAGAVAQLVVNIIAFVLIVIICKIAIRLIGNTLNIFTKLPVIKQFNRLGGAVAGGLIGIVILYIAFALMVAFAPLGSDSKVVTEIENSHLASEMYNNNILLNLINGEE